MARAREAAFSDDDYEDLSRFQRRRRKGERFNKAKSDLNSDFSRSYAPPDEEQQRQFWEEVKRSGARDTREQQEAAKARYQKAVFDEFDEFFNFTSEDEQKATRDDTVGADIKFEIEIDFLEGIMGCEKEITVDKRVVCGTCRGLRADVTEGHVPRRCFECGGRGSFIGNYGIRKKCIKCYGSGC